VLAGFKEFLARRAPEVDFNAVVLFQEAKLLGYTGCYEMIKVFVRPLREELRLAMEATLRFETEPGRQGQVD
jgi:transposase